MEPTFGRHIAQSSSPGEPRHPQCPATLYVCCGQREHADLLNNASSDLRGKRRKHHRQELHPARQRQWIVRCVERCASFRTSGGRNYSTITHTGALRATLPAALDPFHTHFALRPVVREHLKDRSAGLVVRYTGLKALPANRTWSMARTATDIDRPGYGHACVWNVLVEPTGRESAIARLRW